MLFLMNYDGHTLCDFLFLKKYDELEMIVEFEA